MNRAENVDLTGDHAMTLIAGDGIRLGMEMDHSSFFVILNADITSEDGSS